MEKVHSVQNLKKEKVKKKIAKKPKVVEEPVVPAFVPPPVEFEHPQMHYPPGHELPQDYSNYVPEPSPEVPLSEIQTSFNYPGMSSENFGMNMNVNQDFGDCNGVSGNVGVDDGNTSPSQIDPSVNLTPEAFSAVAYLLAFPSYQY